MLEKDDLNPWLALARPRPGRAAADADGRLDLGEIYRLNLAGCELTVLSACNTNLDARQTARLRGVPVGEDEQSLRPGRAGARHRLFHRQRIPGRRLAACHRHPVDRIGRFDRRELVARFFEKLHAQLAAGRPINYARLLERDAAGNAGQRPAR